MDISPSGLARNAVPHIPYVLRTAFLSSLRLTPKSDHQDALTQIIVESARPVLQTPCALSKSQLLFNQDLGVWGQLWIAKYTIPRSPEDFLQGIKSPAVSVFNAIAWAIKELRSSNAGTFEACNIPCSTDVETEWTGYRPGAWHISPRPSGLNERQMYERMMQDVDPDGPTILYFHGGAFCLMDPAIERWPTSALAQATRGCVLAVRYRLAPQNPFPAALIDALTAYLSLLYPPPDAFHKPVHPSKIILSGDSSGAGLAASLQLLLLTLAKAETSISWHRSASNSQSPRSVTIPSPPNAGLALISPWLDISRSLPSTTLNAEKWDILAPPPLDAASPPFPPDSIWPTSPPRAETYCTADLVTHPLVSPLAATSQQWSGCPPVYLCVGWEGMADEAEVFARRVYGSSEAAVVLFDGYEGMPHCFSMFPWNEAGRSAQRNTAKFCRDAVAVTVDGHPDQKKRQPRFLPRPISANWTRSVKKTSTDSVSHVLLRDLGLTQTGCGYERTEPLTDEVVDQKMHKSSLWRIGLEQEMVRRWKEGKRESLQNV